MSNKITLAVGQTWHGKNGFWRRIVEAEPNIEWFGVGVDGRSICKLSTFRDWIKRTDAELEEA